MELIIFTDGASRGNPGNASYGFTIDDDKGEIIYEEGKYIGIETNNVAEYTAVLSALSYVERKFPKASPIRVYADSRLIVEQLSGRFRIKNENLKQIYLKIKSIEKKFAMVSYTHVYREKNKRADALANKALDER